MQDFLHNEEKEFKGLFSMLTAYKPGSPAGLRLQDWLRSHDKRTLEKVREIVAEAMHKENLDEWTNDVLFKLKA